MLPSAKPAPATPPTTPATGRSLKTAAEALAALRLLGANPEGVTADRLAAALGKSASTARYLLNTLCQEGYAIKEGPAGVHRLVDTPPWGGPWGHPEELARHERAEVASEATREWREHALATGPASRPP